MRICTLSGQSIKLHKRPLRSVQWLLIAFALCSFMGMAFAGGCQTTGDGIRPKCSSDEAWREAVLDSFEKAMLKCPVVSRSPQANILRADLKIIVVFGPRWNETLDRVDEVKKVCAVAAPPKR